MIKCYQFNFKSLTLCVGLFCALACGSGGASEQAAINAGTDLDRFNDALIRDPSDIYVLKKRATYYGENNQLHLAVKDWQTLVALQPDSSAYWLGLGTVYRRLGQIQLCYKALNNVEESPFVQEALYTMGVIDIAQDAHQRAMDRANEILHQDAFDARGYNLKGLIYKGIGDTALAISSFQTALEQNNVDTISMVQLADLYGVRGDTLATVYYNRILDIDSSHTTALLNLGLFYQKLGRFEMAEDCYLQYLEYYPRSTHALYNMGAVSMELNQSIASTSQYFEKILAIDSSHVSARLALAILWEGVDDQKVELLNRLDRH